MLGYLPIDIDGTRLLVIANSYEKRSVVFTTNLEFGRWEEVFGDGDMAADGFFGRLKQEFFHKRGFAGVSMDEFIGILDEYMVWYREANQDGVRLDHHGPAPQARPYSMIDGD